MPTGAVVNGASKETEERSVDYGTVQKRKRQARRSPFGIAATKFNVFFVTYFAGIAAFFATMLLFNCALYNHRNVVLALVAIAIFSSASWIVSQKPTSWPFESAESVFCRPLGYACFFAIVVGSVLGLYGFDTWGYFSFIYRNARQYTNVIPSQPAASVADAGRMTFAAEAVVDGTKASGYAAPNAVKYCVAPIRDMVKTKHVEFWAVGYNCCGWKGTFNCDASTDGDARGGIVVFDNPGLFGNSNRDYYDFARHKAEAQYDLVSVKKPLYVRWVANDNLDMLERFYTRRTAGFVFAMTLLYAAVSFYFVNAGCSKHYQEYFGSS